MTPPHAGEDLHRVVHIEVERNEELLRLASPRFRESNRDLRAPVGNGFLAEKPPFALINQRETKGPKLHQELVPVGATVSGPYAGCSYRPTTLLERKVERDGRDILQRWRRFFDESRLPVERLEPEKVIVGAVGKRHQSRGREISVHQENEPLSRFGKKPQMHRIAVDGPVVDHQGMAAVAFVNPPKA